MHLTFRIYLCNVLLVTKINLGSQYNYTNLQNASEVCAFVIHKKNYFAQSHHVVRLLLLFVHLLCPSFYSFTSRCCNTLPKSDSFRYSANCCVNNIRISRNCTQQQIHGFFRATTRAKPNVFVRKPRTRNKTIPQSVFKNSIHIAATVSNNVSDPASSGHHPQCRSRKSL